MGLFPKKDSGFIKKFLFWSFSIFVGISLLGVITLAGLFAYLSVGLPDVTNLENLNAAQSTEIFDREGNLLYTIHGEENREKVPLDQISPFLVDATIALEDGDFWNHKGFDIWALGKVAMYEAFGVGTPRGGSTITQQYIKNTFLSSERSYVRKAKELILAIRLERVYDKEKIMELYLNRIPYGNNGYGAQKAAEIYFNKNAVDLNLAESVILASLPQAPSRYNPYGDNRYSHLLKEFKEDELHYRNITSVQDLQIEEYARGLIGSSINLANGEKIYIPGRTDIVLREMETMGTITEEQKKEALKILQNIEFNNYVEDIQHPHFVIYIKEQLEKKYGKDIVEQGGLKVYTTIDPELQAYAEEIATEYGDKNQTRFDANNLAILTINSKTGEILTMIGSRDYWNEEIDGNVNVALRARQPGSSFKPFVYAQAFYNGYAPGNIVHDIPMTIGTYKPQNYDGGWGGQMSLRHALAQSRNIPAIKAYYLAGEQDPIIDLVTKMGITTLDKEYYYGAPFALGTGEVPLIEMVTAYAVFSTNGKKPEVTGIKRVENSNGDIIEELKTTEFEEVMDPQIAYLINSILSDLDHSLGPNIQIPGKIVAAKTGTSTKENKQKAGGAVLPGDVWTLGYTPTIVTGVWVGNTDGTGMKYNANGYDAAAPIWKAIMTKALQDLPAEPFPEPEGIKHVKIGKSSGKLPSSSTPESMIVTEIFPSFSVPTETEKTFFKVKIDTVSGKLATAYTPEEAVKEVVYQNYEPIADMLNWRKEVLSYYGRVAPGTNFETGVQVGLPPTEYDDVHTASTAKNKPAVTITSPSTSSQIGQGGFNVSVNVNSPNGTQKVEYYINNKLEFIATAPPYTGHLNISKFMTPGSKQLVVAKVTDSLGYSSQSAIEVKVGANGELENTSDESTINTNPQNDDNTIENGNESNSVNEGNNTAETTTTDSESEEFFNVLED